MVGEADEPGAVADEPVAVSRRIEAPAGDVFRIVTDPGRHVDLDGSGMVRGPVPEAVISGLGDVFVMRMHNERHGDYEMDNHVVEYEQDRRVGWEPRPGRGHPDASAPGGRWGHRWVFDLVPDGPGATVVTETFDGSRLPEDKRTEFGDGRAWWIESMSRTLERLDALCTGRSPRPAACFLPPLPDRPHHSRSGSRFLIQADERPRCLP